MPGLVPMTSDNLFVHQQAMARVGMLPMPYTSPPSMLPRLSNVEAMVEALQRLPRRESAVPHVAAHLYHLDKQVCTVGCKCVKNNSFGCGACPPDDGFVHPLHLYYYSHPYY